MSATNVSEIELWLEVILKNENLEDFTVKILGNSEKGDGFIGDIVFVQVTALGKDSSGKEYNLVLKCAKRSKVLREKSPVKDAFLNEIYLYETIFPSFMQFQRERNVAEPFNKIPKCYGTLVNDTMEVIALENLKSKGYDLWDKKKPLTRKHIDMVVAEYAKFHAVSAAMQDQQPEQFKQLTDGLRDLFTKFITAMDMITVFEITAEEIHDLLKNDLPENILLKWKNFKQQIRPFFIKVGEGLDGLNVITHGDCWNNNFLHYHVNGIPSTFAIIDWQIGRVAPPTLDLSYFLFACLSEEDMNDIDTVLKHYYSSVANHVRQLGSDPDRLYPFTQFLDDWKKYGKFGVIMTNLIHKFSLSEKDEQVPDMAEAAERGTEIAHTFLISIKDTESYKKRMSYIVKYVAENDLI